MPLRKSCHYVVGDDNVINVHLLSYIEYYNVCSVFVLPRYIKSI